MTQHIPNILTLIRILTIPFLVRFFLMDQLYLVTLLFGFAALTDGFDGYIARYFNQASSLGAFLDPVADKLIVISLTTLLISDARFHRLIIPAIIMICREVIVSSLREWMAIIGKQEAVTVSTLSKFKTALQMLAIFLCLLSKSTSEKSSLLLSAHITFYAATVFTLVSLVDYAWKAWTVIA